MMCTSPFRITTLDRSVYPDGLLVPCGKCLTCRIKKRSEWTLRLWHELSYWEHTSFPTLTYSDDFLPENASLDKSALQKFFKRLRKTLSDKGDTRKIKYFACGEYGDRTQRPHYHAIIFGVGLTEEDQETITLAWPFGHVFIGSVTPDSIRYVCQYIDKKFTGELANEQYTQKGRQPVFRLVSQGLGRRFAEENKDQILSQRTCTMYGNPMGIPRYYIKKLDIDPDFLRDIGQERSENLCAQYTGLTIDPDVLYRVDTETYKLYYEGMKNGQRQREKNLKAKIALRTNRKI